MNVEEILGFSENMLKVGEDIWYEPLSTVSKDEDLWKIVEGL